MPEAAAVAAPVKRGLPARIADFGNTFWHLRHASRVFWICNLVYTFDAAAYFGILNILTLQLGTTLHFSDQAKPWAVTVMTAGLTLSGALLGGASDRLGVRRTLTLTILLALVGRGLLTATPFISISGLGAGPIAWTALAMMGVSAGVMQPAVYAGVKQATTPENATIAFSLLYALMNGGSLIETIVSPLIRDHYRTRKLPGGESLEYTGVIWVCTLITVVYLAIHLFGFPHREGSPVARDTTPRNGGKPRSWRDHPLMNPRFQFFIFILLGVRTLFAHQYLTLPDYMLRAFPRAVADRQEWIQSINLFVVLFGTPTFAALTRRVNVVTMMIAGTLVSAGATFLLVPGPNVYALIAYETIFSVGEALWSSRFLEYVAEVAPPDKVGVYMGVAQLPWFMAKMVTSSYSGIFMARFCPEHGPQHTGTLWLIYGLMGLTSPIGLLLARKWLRAGTLGR